MAFVRSSEHFSESELACKCGQPDCQDEGMNEDFMADLETLRIDLDQGMIINSAMRCVKHPIEAKKIATGKSPGGAHTKGCAVDIKPRNGHQQYEILWLAFELGFEGIAIETRFIHIDKYAALDARQGLTMSWAY